jgi:3-oxoacyl-[acyl-carrier-protein] synthase II
MALADAGIAGRPDLLEKTDMIVAADGGERDCGVDSAILEESEGRNDPDDFLNEALSTQLRPTLFLAQLSNLLAGNISIVHKLSRSSRTFMGEEMAGVAATEVAVRKIAAGQSDLCLVGGAYNAERPDMQLLFEFGRYLWSGAYKPLWERQGEGGGIVTGSAAAFLVLEARSHALERQARPYARLHDVLADRCDRSPGAPRANAMKQFDLLRDRLRRGPLAVLSGSCGAEPIAGEERRFFEELQKEGFDIAARATGTMLGHSVEAQFPVSVALAAMALSEGRFYAPFDHCGFEKPYSGGLDRVLTTSWGHWRGEAMALIEAIQ